MPMCYVHSHKAVYNRPTTSRQKGIVWHEWYTLVCQKKLRMYILYTHNPVEHPKQGCAHCRSVVSGLRMQKGSFIHFNILQLPAWTPVNLCNTQTPMVTLILYMYVCRTRKHKYLMPFLCSPIVVWYFAANAGSIEL